jgi:hypothetical protein
MPVRGSGEIRLRTGLPDYLEIEAIKADFGAGAIAITAMPALGGKR